MVGFHVHPDSDQADAFRLEAHALFEGVLSGEEDFSARADDALPGNRATAAVEGPCDLTGVAGVSGGVGDVAVGGDFAAGDAADLGEEEFKEIFGRHGR